MSKRRAAAALESIRQLVRPQVVRFAGESDRTPTFLEIYNLACRGLGVIAEPKEEPQRITIKGGIESLNIQIAGARAYELTIKPVERLVKNVSSEREK